MRAVLPPCLLLALVCAACVDHGGGGDAGRTGGTAERKGGPAFTPKAEEIDAFFDPLIKAAIAWEAAQDAAQTPDQMARPAEMPPDQSGQEAR